MKRVENIKKRKYKKGHIISIKRQKEKRDSKKCAKQYDSFC